MVVITFEGKLSPAKCHLRINKEEQFETSQLFLQFGGSLWPFEPVSNWSLSLRHNPCRTGATLSSLSLIRLIRFFPSRWTREEENVCGGTQGRWRPKRANNPSHNFFLKGKRTLSIVEPIPGCIIICVWRSRKVWALIISVRKDPESKATPYKKTL